MLSNFLVKRKLNKLLDKYESIFSDMEALYANRNGIRSILEAQIGLLHCDLLELGVAYDNLLYQLKTWEDRADYIKKSKGVPNTSRIVLVVLKSNILTDFYDNKEHYATKQLETERKRVFKLMEHKEAGLLGSLFYTYANLRLSNELERVKALATSTFGSLLFDGSIELFISKSHCTYSLDTLFTFLDVVNNPTFGWRPATFEGAVGNLADTIGMSDGTLRVNDVIFLPKG